MEGGNNAGGEGRKDDEGVDMMRGIEVKLKDDTGGGVRDGVQVEREKEFETKRG